MNIDMIKREPFVLQLFGVGVASSLLGTAMAMGDGVGQVLVALTNLWLVVSLHWGFYFLSRGLQSLPQPKEPSGQNHLWAVQSPDIPKSEWRWSGTVIFLLSLPAALSLILRCGQGLSLIVIGIYVSLLCLMIFYHKAQNKFLASVLYFSFYGPLSVSLTYYSQSFEINPAVVLAGSALGLFALCFKSIEDRRQGLFWLQAQGMEDSLYAKKITADFLTSLLLIPLIPVLIYFVTWDHAGTLSAAGLSVLSVPAIKLFYHFKDDNSQSALSRWVMKLVVVYLVLFSMGWVV